MTTLTQQNLNDVDLEAVGALVAAVQENPDKGQTEWQATVAWKGAFRSEVSIRDFEPIPSDEPPGLGGTDLAPNPAEQVLGALGNCLAVGYAAQASAHGVEINDLQIEVSGDLDLHSFLGLRDGHAGFGGLSVKVHLDSDATEAQLSALHEKVVGGSPIGHTLSNPVPLKIELA